VQGIQRYQELRPFMKQLSYQFQQQQLALQCVRGQAVLLSLASNTKPSAMYHSTYDMLANHLLVVAQHCCKFS